MGERHYSKKKCLITILILILFSSCMGGEVDSKFSKINSMISDIIWCGKNKETILILTEDNYLYRSTDKGFTFKSLNHIVTKTGEKELNDTTKEIGHISKMILSPIDPFLVIFLGTKGINWTSSDCGENLLALNHGRKIQEFIFHPTERNYALAMAYTICEDFKSEPCHYYKELYVTRNLGDTWNLMASYVFQAGWGIFDKDHPSEIPKDRVLICYEPRGTGNQQVTGWNYKINLIYTDDYFKTKKIILKRGNKFLLTKHYLIVARVFDSNEQVVELMLANSNDPKYNFTPIQLGTEKFKEHSYTFLDTSENSVFLHINRYGEKSRYGHIYISDFDGLKYSLSLKYNYRSIDGQSQFDKINGLEGIYISNVVEKRFIFDNKQIIDVESSEDDGMESHSQRKEHEDPRNKVNNFVETLITFNKGGKWSKLIPPERDSLGKKFDCGDYCHLNLKGIGSETAPFYSIESAIGIVIANGNVGKYLSNDVSEISTFLSRDGGYTWSEVRKGSHVYEIGDHGGLIVMGNDRIKTNSIIYSWDEGKTWQDKKFTNEEVYIKNIIIEPRGTSQHFLIYGITETKRGFKKGFVASIDFSKLHEPKCRNLESPNSQDSDYESWTPNDGRNSRECLMGKKVIYIRRKRDSECFNGQEFERKVVIEQCHCTDDDYECDFGFHRLNIGDICTSVENVPETERNLPPRICNGYYTISRGYRKVPGNSCVGGVKFDPLIIPCPNRGIFSLIGIVLFFVILFILIILILCTFNKHMFQQCYKAIVGNPNNIPPQSQNKNPLINDDEQENTMFSPAGTVFGDEEEGYKGSKKI